MISTRYLSQRFLPYLLLAGLVSSLEESSQGCRVQLKLPHLMTTLYQSQISESLHSFCLNPSSGLTSPQLKKLYWIWTTHTTCLTPWFAHGDKELKETWDAIDKTAAPSLNCAPKLHKHSHWKRNPWGAIVWGTHSSGSVRKQWENLLSSGSW